MINDRDNLIPMNDLPPEILRSINVYVQNMSLDNRSNTNVIKENNFGNNTAIQSDHNTQHIDVANDSYKALVDELLKEVRNLQNVDERNNAIEDIENAEQALSQNNKERARKLFSLLPDVIKLGSTFASLYKVLNSS